MGYNLFAEVTVLPKGYYFCAKGAAEGDERRGKRKTGQWPERNPVTALLYAMAYCDCGCLYLQIPIADFSCNSLYGFDLLVV